MIVKVKKLEPEPNLFEVTADDGETTFSYLGGFNQDMIDIMGDRKVVYFEAEFGTSGLLLGDEVDIKD